jgi:hypothetical protein
MEILVAVLSAVLACAAEGIHLIDLRDASENV